MGHDPTTQFLSNLFLCHIFFFHLYRLWIMMRFFGRLLFIINCWWQKPNLPRNCVSKKQQQFKCNKIKNEQANKLNFPLIFNSTQNAPSKERLQCCCLFVASASTWRCQWNCKYWHGINEMRFTDISLFETSRKLKGFSIS